MALEEAVSSVGIEDDSESEQEHSRELFSKELVGQENCKAIVLRVECGEEEGFEGEEATGLEPSEGQL